jgi:hypothetical protein
VQQTTLLGAVYVYLQFSIFDVYLSFADIQYAAYVCVILWLPDDGYST